MAAVVERYADVVVLTDDDASSENRRDILRDVAQGMSRQLWEQYYLIPNRRDAIAQVCRMVQPWDVVLLAWKGHEEVLVTNFGYEDRSDERVLSEEREKVSG